MIRIVGFRGEIPRVHPRLLPEDAAQVAVNVRLENGALEPMRATKDAHTFPSDTVSFIKRANGAWLGWPERVNAVPGPVNELRTYVTSAGTPPRVLADIGAGQDYPLRLDPPVSPIVASISEGDIDTDTAEGTFYSYTYVTVLAEESQPAQLSNELVISTNVDVLLTFGVAVPSDRGITHVRLYRSQTDALGVTGLYFIAELPVADVTAPWLHVLAENPLNEGIPTTDYDPPVDTLEGIVACANGIMAAFSGQDIYFSEPYRPHAWPTKYSLTVDSDIVGLAALGASVAIMTKGTPYVAQGSTPDAMVLTRLEQNLPCVAALGIVDLGYAVAYPSTEGLVVIDPNSGAKMVSRAMFTREQWAAINGETFIAGQHIGRYIASHIPDGASARQMIIFDLSGEQPFLIRATEPAAGVYFEIGSGILYLRIGERQIVEWDSLTEAKKPLIWRSRRYQMPTLTNFGAILIEADDFTVPVAGNEVRVYADGVLRNTITDFNEVQRLSSGFMARKWEIEARGSLIITSMSIAGTPQELAG